MKMRNLFIVLLLCLTAMTVWANGTQEDGSVKAVELRYATVHPESYPNGIVATEFAKQVEEATEGRVKVIVYYAGELGDQKSYIEQCQLGTLDFADVSSSPMVSFAPELGVLSMPYLFIDRDHKWRVLGTDAGQQLLDTCEQADLYGLSFYEAGSRNYYSKKPIKTLEDLEGQKIRVMQSQVCIDGVKAMGASPVPMAFSEIYSAVQSGVIDGGENNHPTFLSQSHYEVAPYFTYSSHVQIPDMLIGSKSTLDKLSDADKAIVKEVAGGMWKVLLEAYEINEKKAYTELESKGIEFTRLSNSEMQRFRDSVKPVYVKYNGEYGKWIETIQAVD
jgi:tripartite ATP-independent transporter DctP family solute receptor